MTEMNGPGVAFECTEQDGMHFWEDCYLVEIINPETGELTYAKPLTEKQMEDYELKPAPGNPDRVRPSITARLKEGTRGQEPPKEPGQKRSHKNHEER